jgi:L-threonylcarbamoyladenylate synthase
MLRMKTRILSTTHRDITVAAEIIKSGGLVAFPTETVYGLGANALDADAVNKIYRAKGRPADNPLIIHINDTYNLKPITHNLSVNAQTLMDEFWPGALTLVLPTSGLIPPQATAGLPSVAVRMPQNEVALELIRLAGVPIAAPSANTAGKPSPTLVRHVLEDLDGKIDAVIDGGETVLGIESTVIDVTVDPPRLLRPGTVTKEMLEAVIGEVRQGTSNTSGSPVSPGMKYKHYSPKAKVVLFNPTTAEIEKINNLANKKTGIFAPVQNAGRYLGGTVIVSGNLDEPSTIAANLYKSLREFDYRGVDTIYAEVIPTSGTGAAIMNRLRKAAGMDDDSDSVRHGGV